MGTVEGMRTWESRQLLVRTVTVLVGAVVLGAGLAYALTDRQPDAGGSPPPATSQVLEESAEREKAAPAEPEPTATPARKRRSSERRDGKRTRRTAKSRLAGTPSGTSERAASNAGGNGRTAAPRRTAAPQGTATPAPRRSGRRPATQLEPVATPRRTPRPESTSAP